MQITAQQKTVDFSELEHDVLARWEDNDVDFWEDCLVDTQSDAGYMYESNLTGWAEAILNDPDEMLMALGYNAGDYATWIANREQ